MDLGETIPIMLSCFNRKLCSCKGLEAERAYTSHNPELTITKFEQNRYAVEEGRSGLGEGSFSSYRLVST